MFDEREAQYGDLIPAGGGDDSWYVEYRDRETDDVVIRPPRSYRQAYGGDPIRVGFVEFRIMVYLASRPYYAFTLRQIAGAVSTPDAPVAEAAIEGHVASLRDQLGIFHDFVQVVPGVGYRFKA